MLLHLLDVFAAYGWEIHARIDMTQSEGEGIETDTWFLRKLDT